MLAGWGWMTPWRRVALRRHQGVRLLRGPAGVRQGHPVVGSSQNAVNVSPVPIINAGEGEHPTQAFFDVHKICYPLKVAY
ncbi:hypothetical protein PTTG_27816 [Puccinia triticina 1-1 BBBD Race 1]|uniref:Aspartate/ornithine carbamoyltransferase carbamoyl-P binding domain-containing protein n=1 Tax=Puccinia triticina (isolate 1-1 / race 1 (BBBD)) TaxID=630390 RepID=A0A180GH03_PUCT1|nr:hypothetical protein PTTG_27816 [Puccinia triticina 1-1 BBBD Race 1]